MNLKATDALRHLAAAASLFLAWGRLNDWYANWSVRSCLLYWLLLASAVSLAGFVQLPRLLKGVSKTRLLFVAAIFLFALPWGEWFQYGLPASRGDWTRRLYLEFVSVYAGLVVLSLFPAAARKLAASAIRALTVASRQRLDFLIPVLFFALSTWVVFVVYDRTPLVQDAAAHLFQARIFRAGHLYASAPPAPEAFSTFGDMLVLRQGKWYSSYLPGFSLVLAAAMLLKLEWLLCPALGAATVGIWMAYANRWHNRRIGVVLGVLCLFSPMILLMHSGLMIHTAELLYGSLLIYLCRRECEEPSTRRAVAVGAVLFLAVITRGFSLLPFVAPVLLYTLAARNRNHFAVIAAATVAGIALGAVAIGLYQYETTGSPWLAAYTLEGGQAQYYGFGGEFLGQKHTPLRALENTSNSVIGMNIWLSGWPTGSLVFVVLFFLRNKWERWDQILLTCCLCLAAFYFFYVFQDLIFGPRFWFPMTPVLLLFVARAISASQESRGRALQLALLSLAAFLVFLFPDYLRLYAPQKQQVGRFRAALDGAGAGKSLVLLDRKAKQDLVNWNDPFLRENVIICNKHGIGNPAVAAAFPGYRILYFREFRSTNKASVNSEYRLMPAADPNPPGTLSLQEFTLMLDSANEFRDHDIFDSSYTMFFVGDPSSDQLVYLRRNYRIDPEDRSYRAALKASLVDLVTVILLPKDAFEKDGSRWDRNFDFNLFRSDLEDAFRRAGQAGSVGEIVSRQVERIRLRIDRNRDGILSDPEIRDYLAAKIRNLETGGNT